MLKREEKISKKMLKERYTLKKKEESIWRKKKDKKY